MARIRTIKPEFWTDEKVVALSPLARLLFIGMWNFVDDEGRSEFSPTRLKMQILPADSADISELLGEIQREKLVSIYDVDGKAYFEVCGFQKHQKVDHRVKSKHPSPLKPTEARRNVPPDQVSRIKEGIKEEEKEDGGADAPTANGRIVFEAGIIRLTAKDLAGWQKSYFAIPDIEAELRAASDYFAEHPPRDGKWWFPASSWLKRSHEAALAKRAEKDDDPVYRGVI